MLQRVAKYCSTLMAPMLSMLGIFVLLNILQNYGYLQFLELATYDLLVTIAARDSHWDPPLAVISVSETDIQRLGNWPLTDDQMADILEKLLAASPKVIGIDIYRDLPVPPGTERLRSLLLNQPNIIVIEKFPTMDSPGIKPPAVLAGSDRVGFSDLATDAGGVVRRNLIFQTVDNKDGSRTGYSFSLRLALTYLAQLNIYLQAGEPNPEWMRLGKINFIPIESHDGGYANVDSGGYQILLEYIGGGNPFLNFTLSDIWDGRIDKNQLHNRILILGENSEGVKDRFGTPHAILGSQEIAGSVIHAHAVRQFLEAALHERNPIMILSNHWEYIWLMLWIGTGALVGWIATSSLQLTLGMISGSVILILGCAFAFHHGWWIPFVPAMLGWQGAIGLNTALRSGQRRHEQQILMGLFARHVSPQVAETIWVHRDEVLESGRIRPQVLPVTILFSDLQGFTKVSESLPPEIFLEWLNGYLGAMTDVIMRFGGVLDDYAGDGIKANFGVPIAHTGEQIAEDARQAVACALALGPELNRLNKISTASGHPRVGMRIGIHSGSVVVGTVGSNLRMKYTTVGSAVNLASRLESLKDIPGPNPEDEQTSCRILISAATADLLGNTYSLKSHGEFQLRGIQHETKIFSLGPWSIAKLT